jgi:hypothetical protein
MRATQIGNLQCEVTQIDREKFIVALNDVKYVPSLCVNLYRLNKELKKGFKVNNHGFIVSLNYKHIKLAFDCVINATDGCVTEVTMKPIIYDNINGFANASIRNLRTFDINYLYKLFEHCGQETLSNTFEMY